MHHNVLRPKKRSEWCLINPEWARERECAKFEPAKTEHVRVPVHVNLTEFFHSCMEEDPFQSCEIGRGLIARSLAENISESAMELPQGM
jgi:hypothetical protein